MVPMDDVPSRIGFGQALEIVRRATNRLRLGSERLPVRRVDGRVLASALRAPVSLPPFDNSRMDGFALRSVDVALAGPRALRIVGEQYAGKVTAAAIEAGECVRITTGAPIPPGADAVVIKERARVEQDMLRVEGPIVAGADIRRVGEDVNEGEPVLEAGIRLTPARIGLASALGIADVEVSRRPTVAVFTTGDELVEPGMPLAPGQIYNSNRDLLMALLRQQGLEPTAWPVLPDDPARIRSQLQDAAGAFDLVITCGGVSAGEKDHLPALVAELGEILFWKVRMKPGMPVLLGQVEQALVLCLPGNPVSAFATFMALGVPLLDGLQGATEQAPRLHAALSEPWHKRHERHEFLRGRLEHGADARLWIRPNSADASHQLRGVADNNALLVLPEGERDYAVGDIVEVIRY